MEQLYLSRRNLMVLLSKLDRKAKGEATKCSIVKFGHNSPDFPQSMDTCQITAVEDAEYYAGRTPGTMHPLDEPQK